MTTQTQTPHKSAEERNHNHRDAAEHKHHPRTKKNTRKPLIVFGIILILAAVAGGIWTIATRGTETTDDAFIDAHIVAISPKVSGQILKVYVEDNQNVKADDPLIDIDPRDYNAQAAEQNAKVLSAEADTRRATADAQRYENLFRHDEISRQQLDNVRSEAAKDQAILEQERAALEQAQLNLSYTVIRAPESGRITKKSAEAGAYVQVGQAILSLVPDRLYVTANFKETQLTRMRPGQKVTVRVDSYPKKRFDGHVDSLQSGTGERFSVMPPENATGNFVKVVQRVPVKIIIDTPVDPAYLLAPGMSVEATVTVK